MVIVLAIVIHGIQIVPAPLKSRVLLNRYPISIGARVSAYLVYPLEGMHVRELAHLKSGNDVMFAITSVEISAKMPNPLRRCIISLPIMQTARPPLLLCVFLCCLLMLNRMESSPRYCTVTEKVIFPQTSCGTNCSTTPSNRDELRDVGW